MIVDFEEIRKNLIGLGCCYIRVGYGGKLRIGLGDKIDYKQPRLQGKFYGEWDMSSIFCSWRISEGKTLLRDLREDRDLTQQELATVKR